MWAHRQESCCFAWWRASSLWTSNVVGLWPEVHVLRVPCAAAGGHVHPARQGGSFQAGDGPETGQGWLPLPAEPQQGPREDMRGETHRNNTAAVTFAFLWCNIFHNLTCFMQLYCNKKYMAIAILWNAAQTAPKTAYFGLVIVKTHQSCCLSDCPL